MRSTDACLGRDCGAQIGHGIDAVFVTSVGSSNRVGMTEGLWLQTLHQAHYCMKTMGIFRIQKKSVVVHLFHLRGYGVGLNHVLYVYQE